MLDQYLVEDLNVIISRRTTAMPTMGRTATCSARFQWAGSLAHKAGARDVMICNHLTVSRAPRSTAWTEG